MVLIAYKNDKIVSAQEATKGIYECIACKSELCYVSKSKTEKISHFRHKTECEYSKKINQNIDMTSAFNLKWTLNLVKAEYLYPYWGNKNIADIKNKDGKVIVVKNSLLKYSDYINEEIVWILNTEKRQGEIYKIKYENGKEEYIYKTEKRYDLNLIPKNHKIFLDGGLNELIEIIDITTEKISCRLVQIEDFLEKYFKDIRKSELEFEDICFQYQDINGYKEIETKVNEINMTINKNIIESEKRKKDFLENLEGYLETYDEQTNKKVKIIVIKTTSNYNEDNYYVLKENDKYPLNFFLKIIELYVENLKYKVKDVEMFFNIRERCSECNKLKYEENIKILQLMKISPNSIMKKEKLLILKDNYCKISDTKKERSLLRRKISFNDLLDYYKSINRDIEKLNNLKIYLSNYLDIVEDEKEYKECNKCIVLNEKKEYLTLTNFNCEICLKKLLDIKTIHTMNLDEIQKVINMKYDELLKEKHQECYKKYLLGNECKYIEDNIKNYEKDMEKLNELKGWDLNYSYERKYNFGFQFRGDKLDFAQKCDRFIDETLSRFENEIYIKKELDKKLFEESYYLKYYRTLKAIRKYGDHHFHHEESWGGWNGNLNIVDGCHKPKMYKFIKHYNLTNPMSINKLYRSYLTTSTKVNLFPVQNKNQKIRKKNIMLDLLISEMNDKMENNEV